MNKVKVGVVGCGFVAQKRHIPSFLRLGKKVALTAVCDLNMNLAKDVAGKFGIRATYSNVLEMISKERLDVVDICTPPQAHSNVAIQAMEAGCHVLMEKPMALTVSDCDKMINTSHKTNRKLSVVHNQRFYPPFLKAKVQVESGAIGELTGMRILNLTQSEEYLAHENHWIHKLPGGIIGETGPHMVYLSLAFLKNVRNVDVHASKKSAYPWVLYDDYRIELEAENITSSIYVSHANSYTHEEVELFGTNCALKVDMQSMILLRYKCEHLKPSSVALSSLNAASQTIKGVASNALRLFARKPMLGHDVMIEKYADSIINDQPVPVTPEEGRDTVRVMDMLVEKLNQKCQDNYPPK